MTEQPTFAEERARLESLAKERWDSYRKRNGIPEDAPFIGSHPLDEALAELADAWNYIQVLRQDPDWGLSEWPATIDIALSRLVEAAAELWFLATVLPPEDKG